MPLWAPSATLGQTTQPSFGVDFSGANTDNEIAWSSVTILVAAIIHAVSVYMAGHTAAVNAKGCVWDGTGTLLQNSDTASVAKGSGAAGGQFLTTFLLNLAVAANAVMFIGWWRQASQDAEWSVAGSGTFKRASNAGANPGNLANPPTDCAGGGYACGDIEAYCTYKTTFNPKDFGATWAFQFSNLESR